MSGIDDIIKSSFSEFKVDIEKRIEKGCRLYCSNILESALKARLRNPNAHNFTGNLLNSIVVCLYKKGKPLTAYYAAGKVDEPICAKMSFRGKYTYRFNPDYDGARSRYIPTVKTDGGWGQEDARRFFADYKPQGENLFDIVVAYPVEYAEWVDMQRQTTGFMQTFQYAERTGLTFLQAA